MTFLGCPEKMINQQPNFVKLDFDDCFVTADLFDELTVKRWGIAAINRFASEKNSKTQNTFAQRY